MSFRASILFLLLLAGVSAILKTRLNPLPRASLLFHSHVADSPMTFTCCLHNLFPDAYSFQHMINARPNIR
jgi:hypothetical protein